MITKEAIEAGLNAAIDKPLDEDDVRAILTAAFAAMPGPAVKVKPLEWDRESPTEWKPETWKAQSLVDEYDIQREKDGTFSGFAPNAGTNIFSSLEAAKAAAQADYEARIMSSLTPAPDLASENERLRAALYEIANAYTAHGYSDAMDAVQLLRDTAKEAINAKS